ncbi:hypothetical protein CCH79_00000224, partial [Gambusia affinis]
THPPGKRKECEYEVILERRGKLVSGQGGEKHKVTTVGHLLPFLVTTLVRHCCGVPSGSCGCATGLRFFFSNPFVGRMTTPTSQFSIRHQSVHHCHRSDPGALHASSTLSPLQPHRPPLLRRPAVAMATELLGAKCEAFAAPSTPAVLIAAMPVHSREKKESNHEEMEVDFPEQDGSSTDEEDTVSSTVSEDGDSSEMDDEDCERRRMECLDEMTTLEKQFTDLKEQLYKERLSQVEIKLQEVMAGCAQEYLEPLANLQENMQIRTKVAGIYKDLCLESVKNKYECEIQAACQHWESEKLLLFDTVQSELEEKIRRLEEDRHSIDITSELWNDGLQARKNKKKDPFCPVKKKKPVVVSDILSSFPSLIALLSIRLM